MGDIDRLRRFLWPAVVATPLLTGCDESKNSTSVEAKNDAKVQVEGKAVEKADGGGAADGTAVEKADGGRAADGTAVEKADGGGAADGKAVEKADDGEADAGEAEGGNADAEVAPEPVGRSRPWTCEEAHWCGSASKAKTMATDPTSLTGKCVTEVKLPAGTDAIDSFTQTHGELTARLSTRTVTSHMPGGKVGECCYMWTYDCRGGRPLMDGADALRASAVRGSGWAEDIGTLPLPAEPSVREALGRAWLADALSEHASVAAFARATLELMAVGAPPELLAETQRAGLDEVRHASACFGLARAYGVETVAPGPCPLARPREVDRATVARSTFIEGCVGETIAALVAQRSAARCTDPAVRAVLRQIADDEARHAALAWRTVRWALLQERVEVSEALHQARVSIEASGVKAVGAEAMPDYPRYGRLGSAAVQEAAREAWSQIVVPMLEQLLA